MVIRVLGFPTRHPYTSKLTARDKFEYVNPDTDYFNGYGGEANPDFIAKTHKEDSYDLVHIHFSFDKLTPEKLEQLLSYFKSTNKPIIWTCHSRESQREKDLGHGDLQKLLYRYAKLIISPTEGCKRWIESTFGTAKIVSVVPLGFMASPEDIAMAKEDLAGKNRNNFVYLLGDFRKNKESVQSIINFLQCSALKNCTLTLIMKPAGLYMDEFITINPRLAQLWNTASNHPRIDIVSLPEIPSEVLVKIFCRSHVCMLPYLWGTHSGQVELCKDCGCYPVISDVGFYAEQSDQIIDFAYNPNPTKFAYNLTKAMIEAYNKPILKPDLESRSAESIEILDLHEKIYQEALQ